MLVSGIVVIAALWGNAVVRGDPSLVINLDKVTMETTPNNPYVGKTSVTFAPKSPLNTVSFSIPILQDLPSTMMLKLVAEVGGKTLPEVVVSLCKALKDPVIGKGFIDHSDLNPPDCPVKKNDVTVLDYTVSVDNMPPGLPSGKLKGTVEFFEEGKPRYAVINFEGTMSRKAPGLG